MLTSPVASITTGVLVALRWNLTITPVGMVTEVKLNMPDGGSGTVVFTVGANGPSAPVLPLVNANAPNDAQLAPRAAAIAMAFALVVMVVLLLVNLNWEMDRVLMEASL
jgi:hypothetical protein